MKVGDRFSEVSTQPKFAEPKARGVLDPVERPVFACNCKMLFDIWRRLGGLAGEKCATRGSAEASPEAPSTLTRGKFDVSRGTQKTSQRKNIKCSFSIHFESIWLPFTYQQPK
jgi:hypothetical protein